MPVHLSPKPLSAFRVLFKHRETPVTRDALRDAIWPAWETLPEEFDLEGNLDNILRRLRDEITKGTKKRVSGRDLVQTKDGVYWLHGIIKLLESAPDVQRRPEAPV
jgi:DNA-binding response OmpR family regulator